MKLFFKSVNILLVAGISAVALLVMASLIPIPGNFKVKVVKSGSMEPTIQTGGIVVIKPAPPYKVGDIITFGKDTKTEIPTTHRIIEVEGEGNRALYLTKGDANDGPDPIPTPASSVLGKVLFTVPYAGYVLDFAKQPLGFIALVGLPAALIILDELGKIFREIRAMRRKKHARYAEQPEQKHTKIRE